jgi:ATP-dependent helicase/nuclease subunit A
MGCIAPSKEGAIAVNEASRAQLTAARPETSTWLSANAGSGKTRVLTDRVARLLLEDVAPEHILCLTYTKAAAAEMQNRLFKRLGEWAMLNNEDLRHALSEVTDQTTHSETDLAHARTLFARAIEAPGGLKIQTIHSFCSSLLRRFPLEAGVTPDFTEIDELARDEIAKLALNKMSENQMDRILFNDMNRLVSEASFDTLLTEIISRKSYFSNRASSMQIASFLGAPQDTSVEQLFHSSFNDADLEFVKKLVPILHAGGASAAKLSEKLLLCTERSVEKFTVLETVFLKSTPPFEPKIDKIGTKVLREGELAPYCDELNAFMQRIHDFKHAKNAIKSLNASITLSKFGCRFVEIYEEEKQRRGWLDFEDLILKTKDLLSISAVAQWVLFRLDGGIDHILVDEAQDTSPTQWAVIEKLAEEFTSGSGARDINRTIFVVGDKKQSIYSFQGADPREFDRMREEFATKLNASQQAFQSTALEYSFRSSPAILRCVDHVFAQASKAGFTEQATHKAFHTTLPGRVDLWPVIPPSEPEDEGNWEDPVDIMGRSSETGHLAQSIAHEISELLNSETVLPDKLIDGEWTGRKIEPRDFLILVQNRKDLFHEIIRACKNLNIPIAGADRLRLLSELAVKDLLAVLEFLALPEDSLALATILKSPLFGWNEQRLFTLAHDRDGKHLFEAMRTNRKEYQNELSVLEDLRNKTDLLRPFDILERILTKHKGRGRFLSRLGPEAKDGIDSLLSIALEYEAVEVPSLVGFIAWVRDKDIEIKRQMDNAQNQVRVMTVHGSKGLEAPIVILPDTLDRRADVRGHFFDADDLVVWSGTKNDRPAAIAELYDLCFEKEKEERNRLLYVAMTRAEKWLIVAGAGKVQNASECWHSQITEGIEAAGGVRLTTPVGNGRRLEYGNWPVLQNANVEKTGKDQVELPTWLQNSPANQEERSVLISPSELPGSKALPSDVNWDSETAKNYGSYVHLLLENLPVHPTENWPQIANNLRVKLEQPIDENIALHAYESAKQALGTPDLSWIFEKDAFAEVPFVTVLPEYSERCFHGIIDRLIVQDETVFVVDFKTNRAIPETAEQIPIGILNQMVIYEHAIKQLYQKYAIKTGILWTAEAKFMEIPQRILLDAKTNLCKS